MRSLNSRMLIAATLVLAGFLGLTGWALDRAFRTSAEAAMKDRLLGYVYTLVAAADLRADGYLNLPGVLPEARFNMPDSGLYAEAAAQRGAQRWQSPSMLGRRIPFAREVAPGASVYQYLTASDGAALYGLSFGLAWEVRGVSHRFTFSVAESLDNFRVQVRSFRRNLMIWLGGAALVLLAVQGTILRWGLAPLRRVAHDLEEIERGAATQLEGQYPRELRGLTDNLNALIRNERAQLERYRNTLADLAHSLKTPLAVMRGVLERGDVPAPARPVLDEQVQRMDQIVEHQLRRAAGSRQAGLAAAPVAVEPVVQRLCATLRKVYLHKNVSLEVSADPEAVFYGDEGDLMELLGNLIDNSCKYCRRRVRVGVEVPGAPQTRRAGLILVIEDDGPGIASDKVAIVMQRGMRADESVTGHGIGLAVTQDIVRAYGGRLDIDTSPDLGGARVRVQIA